MLKNVQFYSVLLYIESLIDKNSAEVDIAPASGKVNSPFLHYPLVPSFKKSILEIQVTRTPLTSFWLPVFPILIFRQQETSR